MSPVTPSKFTSELTRFIGNDPMMGEGIKEMSKRSREFSSITAAKLAGIAMVPAASEYFNQSLGVHWEYETRRDADEIIIGGGFHAAVYAATRRKRMRAPYPLVIDGGRIGGSFAVSRNPSFYLNSRNRPGDLGIPGMGSALNVIPYAPVQPSDLSSDEYQRNSDLAYAIRTTLAMNAYCLGGVWVTQIQRKYARNRKWLLRLSDGTTATCDRIIIATGLGTKYKSFRDAIDNYDKVVGFMDFMAMMDAKFPLRGMSRVAVIGAGDSGRTAIEALTGQGPSSGWSVASVDYPQQIDWYGCKQPNRSEWEECNRRRYRNIGGLLGSRVTPMPLAAVISGGLDVAYVNERPYDAVIVCTGFTHSVIEGEPSSFTWMMRGDRRIAQTLGDDSLLRVGPRAEIPLSASESGVIGSIKENSTALFRYAERTATAAASVMDPEAPKPKAKVIGTDRNGNPISIGDTVTVYAEGYTGVVEGVCEGSETIEDGRSADRVFIGLSGIEDGGYTVDGQTVWGVYSGEVTKC